jgi:dihydrofolate reductase
LNVVLTRDPGYAAPGATVAGTLQAALDACAGEAGQNQAPLDPYVIGGAQIYALALPLARRILATEVHADVPGDAFFPELPAAQWRETAREPQAEENGYAYDFVIYERI